MKQLNISQINRFRELAFKEGNKQELTYHEKQEIANLCKFLNFGDIFTGKKIGVLKLPVCDNIQHPIKSRNEFNLPQKSPLNPKITVFDYNRINPILS